MSFALSKMSHILNPHRYGDEVSGVNPYVDVVDRAKRLGFILVENGTASSVLEFITRYKGSNLFVKIGTGEYDGVSATDVVRCITGGNIQQFADMLDGFRQNYADVMMGKTPVNIMNNAIASGDIMYVKIAMLYGVNLNIPSSPSLNYATSYEDRNIVKLFIDMINAGIIDANVYQPDLNNHTPFSLALKTGNYSLVSDIIALMKRGHSEGIDVFCMADKDEFFPIEHAYRYLPREDFANLISEIRQSFIINTGGIRVLGHMIDKRDMNMVRRIADVFIAKGKSGMVLLGTIDISDDDVEIQELLRRSKATMKPHEVDIAKAYEEIPHTEADIVNLCTKITKLQHAQVILDSVFEKLGTPNVDKSTALFGFIKNSKTAKISSQTSDLDDEPVTIDVRHSSSHRTTRPYDSGTAGLKYSPPFGDYSRYPITVKRAESPQSARPAHSARSSQRMARPVGSPQRGRSPQRDGSARSEEAARETRSRVLHEHRVSEDTVRKVGSMTLEERFRIISEASKR
jgi:hypothetical protein